MLIDSLWISGLFGLASLMKAYGRQWEHALTRVFIALTYLAIGQLEMPIETAREFSRYFVFLLAFVEVISWIIIQFRRRK